MSFILGSDLQNLIVTKEADRKRLQDLIDSNRRGEIEEIGVFPDAPGERIEPSQVGNITVDLTVGSHVIVHSKRASFTLSPTTQSVMLEPGDTAIVLTREFIVVPADIGGLVLSKATFVWDGFGQGTTKVDPTWYGCLHVTLINHTRSQLELKYRKPFCSMLFFRLPRRIDKDHFLYRTGTQHLGQSGTIGYTNTATRGWPELKPTGTISDEAFEVEVNKYGPPLDAVRNRFLFERQKTITEIHETIRSLDDQRRNALQKITEVEEKLEGRNAAIKEDLRIEVTALANAEVHKQVAGSYSKLIWILVAAFVAQVMGKLIGAW